MMGRERNATGAIGERIAVAFLKKKGYRITATNVRTPFGEIDIVARTKDRIVFVEVKTRRGNSLGPPCISITEVKKRHIINNALFYMKRRGLPEAAWRIDVVSVRLGPMNNVEEIELIENAVQRDGW